MGWKRWFAGVVLGVVSMGSEASAQFPVSVLPPLPGYRLPASFIPRNCTADQIQIVQRAADEAMRLLLAGGTVTGYGRWFGPLNSTPDSVMVRDAVQFVRQYALHSLSNLAAGIFPASRVRIDCMGRLQEPAAHVTGPNTALIYLDAGFWIVKERPVAFDATKASVLIHELSHLAGTEDGHLRFPEYQKNPVQFALDLAVVFPTLTFLNATNHEYYFLNR